MGLRLVIALATLLAALLPSVDGAGCRVLNDCDGPSMVCYENYGNCICANGSCLCDGACGPVWWLIMIFVIIFLFAIVGLILMLRCCCCRKARYSAV
jgi:hypothetical protein